MAKTYGQTGFVFGEKLFAFVGSRVAAEIFWVSCKTLYPSKEISSNILSLYHFKKHVSYFLDSGLALACGMGRGQAAYSLMLLHSGAIEAAIVI